MEIKLTSAESETMFHTALCNGLSWISGYGLELKFGKEAYQSAKENLKAKSGEGVAICYEDVLLQILRDGGTLTLVDREGDDEEHSISLQDVHDRVQKTEARFLIAMTEEQDDAETADVILQTTFLGEVIFG